MFNKKQKSGGWIYGAYSGPILPPMLGLGSPGGKKVLILTKENGFAITDGVSVYGGKARTYDPEEDIKSQIKDHLYAELREFCGEDNEVYSARDFKEFIYRKRDLMDDLDEQFMDFLDACERRIKASFKVQKKIDSRRDRLKKY